MASQGLTQKRAHDVGYSSNIRHERISLLERRLPAMDLIRLELGRKNQVTIRPAGFLGGSFGAFRGALEGAKFDGPTKTNYASLDKVPRILTRLRDAGFQLQLSEELAQALKGHEQESKVLTTCAVMRLDRVEEALAARGLSLFGFQRTGVEWLAGRTGALLADEMGLGKTVQTLAALPDATPIVVVAPAVAKGVWLREARKWRPEMKVTVLSGRGSFRWPEAGEMIVINYDILPDSLTDAPAGTCLVADEAHALKNFKAKRTQKFRTLSDNVRAQGGRTWLLTATPLLNRPTELWGILSAAGLEREVFGTWGQFVSLFGGQKDRWGGMQWGTPSPEVPGRLARVSLRRMRAHVLPDLPVKTWQDIEVDLGAALTRKCDALTSVLEKDGTSLEEVTEKVLRDKLSFTDFSAVRAALATAKIPALMALVEEFEAQDEPLVVFSAHRAPIDQFEAREGWAVITGDTSPEERTRIEEAFQAGQLRGVAATIQAGGVAITLTRSHNAIFVDRDWTPAINNQAEDRICRIGQDRGCIITNLVGSHKIERRMSALLTIKTAMATAALPTSTTMTDEVPVASIDELIAASSLGTPEAVRLRAQANPEAVALALAGSVPPAPKSERQVAQNAQEEWAYDALMTLAGLDTDRAAVVNGVGFNKMDGDFGHSLAQQASTKGLTRKQWAAAIKLCGKYYRQVGRCPVVS